MEGRQWSDFAVFYRVNALSREIELALSRHRVPYQVAAGVAFYDRAEVKDMLAYLRLVYNPADDVAFRRIVNRPARGIGKMTISRLAACATVNQLNLLETATTSTNEANLSTRAKKALIPLFENDGRFLPGPGRIDRGVAANNH